MIYKISPRAEAEKLVNEYLRTGMLITQAKKCAQITVNRLIEVTGAVHWYLVRSAIEHI